MLRRIALLLLVSVAYLQVQAQTVNDDFAIWSWMKLEGTVDHPEDLDPKNDKIAYSLEVQYRIKDRATNFSQTILRPMVGYRVNENLTLWIGTAHIERKSNGEILGEQRAFQMLSYSGKLKNAPVVFISNTRLEQSILEDHGQMSVRIRQMLRVSVDLFKFHNSKLTLFFQDEYFHRLNDSSWAGRAGFDQNRLMVGLDLKTHIRGVPVVFTAGYINSANSDYITHGVGLGVKIYLPGQRNKKDQKQKKKRSRRY